MFGVSDFNGMICHLPHPVAAAPVFGGAYNRIVGAIMRQKQDGAGYIRIISSQRLSICAVEALEVQ